MTSAPKFAGAALGAALLLSAPPAPADGGGGGGNVQPNSAPSMSARSYDPTAEYKKGLEALQAQNYKDADRAFGRVLQSLPRDPNTNYMAGLARAGLGELKQASRLFEKAIKYDDNLIPAHQELGIAWAKLEKPDKAKAVLDDLKQRAAACADACPQAADLKAAIPAVEAALGGPPTSQLPAAQDVLAAGDERGDRAYLQAVSLINEKKYESAIAALNDSARTFGPHPDILTYLGYANRKLGRYAVAEDYYRQALAAAPDHLGATEYYGELMVERGDLAGAKRMLAKLENVCSFGCAQADELRRWIAAAKPDAS
ncbi:tetratricopeptide repeat protein [Luteimonas sp. SX5]|uniref:Tetratricopeptide repeat protein n=1 Tax=Luteimonas galliterrae TaxID=2940486 RepID=A0ABT0MLE4_9GAMM|nr:tetratricopeptide repeat protein [Luteimonas galliterrae]MCL1635696.1 tetratricopeptide repeat protein [Luteimonas galliterrae]